MKVNNLRGYNLCPFSADGEVEETDRKTGIVILVPHSSIYDLLAIVALRQVTCVARYQVKNIWFLSSMSIESNRAEEID